MLPLLPLKKELLAGLKIKQLEIRKTLSKLHFSNGVTKEGMYLKPKNSLSLFTGEVVCWLGLWEWVMMRLYLKVTT